VGPRPNAARTEPRPDATRSGARACGARARGRRRRAVFVVAAFLALLVAGLLPALAQADPITAAMPGFDGANTQAFHLNGSAQLASPSLSLNNPWANQGGAAWWQHKVQLSPDRSFSACFSFHTTPPYGNGGADGLTFAIQQTSNSAVTYGGGMGYEGITPSVAVELDTWWNGSPYFDIDDNHVGIDVNGSMHSVDAASSPWDLSTSDVYYAWVDYNGATDLLEVRLNDSIIRPAAPLLSYTVDLVDVVAREVFVGFTGSTGGSWEGHDIDSFYFANDYTPLDPANVPYVQAAVTNVSVTALVPALSPSEMTSVTARATDIGGNPVAGQQLSFTSSEGIVGPEGLTDADGYASVQFTAGPTDAFTTITATADGGAYGATTVTVGAPTPVTTASGLAFDDHSDWQSGPGSVTFLADDGSGPGVMATYYTIDGAGPFIYALPLEVVGEGSHVICYWSVDLLGRAEAPHTGYVNIHEGDSAPPTTTATGLRPWWMQVWVSSQDVTLTADDAGGSGVDQIYYSVDGGPYATYAGTFTLSASGSHSVYYYAVDNAGNEESPQDGYAAIDATPPTSDSNVSADGSRWSSGDVYLSATDDESGVAHTYYSLDGADWQECTSSSFFVGEDGPHSVDYYSEDAVGNKEDVKSGLINIDTTPPATAPEGLIAGGTLWVNGPRTVTFTADDGAGSGVDGTTMGLDGAKQHYAGPFEISGEGSHYIYWWSFDKAGNYEAFDDAYVNIDMTPPTTTATGLVADGETWSRDPQTVTLTADAGAGAPVAATYYTVDGGAPQTYTGEFEIKVDGAHVVAYWSEDQAGNAETPKTGYVDLDRTPPVTTAGGIDHSGWAGEAQTVTLSAGDGAGSGVDVTYYSLDGAPQEPYTGPFEVSGEGPHHIDYWSVDELGNAEAPKTDHLTIDMTPPVTTAAGVDDSGTLLVGHTQTVTLTPDDGEGAGVAGTFFTVDGGTAQPYDGPFLVAGEGQHTVTYWSADYAGNTEEAGIGTVTIDTTPPVTTAVTVQPNDHTGYVHGPQSVTLSASDDCGVAATFYTLDGGVQQPCEGPVPVSGLGSHTLTYWSVDTLGNVEEAQTGFVNIAPETAVITTATGLNGDDHSGWTNTTRTVTLRATGGVAPLMTYYTVDGGPQQTYGGPFQITSEGAHVVTYWSVDQQPVTEAHNTGYANLDLTAPVTQPAILSAWRNTALAVPAGATDARSGVASTSFRIDGGPQQTGDALIVPAPSDHSMDGTHVVTVSSADKAGNVEVAKQFTVRIDTTKPGIKLKKTLFVWRHDRISTIKFRATDKTVTEVRVQLKVTQYGKDKTKIFKLGLRRCGRWYVGRFKCTLPAWHYNLHMQAIDYAGNVGSKAGLILVRK
jgi:hypothetical protein